MLKFWNFDFSVKIVCFHVKKSAISGQQLKISTLDGDQELQLEVFNCFDFRFQRCNCLNNFEFSSTVDQELKCFQTLQESLPDLGVLARVRNTGSSNFYRIKTSANFLRTLKGEFFERRLHHVYIPKVQNSNFRIQQR